MRINDKKALEKILIDKNGILSSFFHDEFIDYYKLSDKSVAIFSKVVNYGFVYPDYNYFKEIYNPNSLVNIFENILAYNDMNDKYIKRKLSLLEKKFNIQLYNKYDITTINLLSKSINRVGKHKIYKSLSESLFLYLGEVIREKVNGEWSLKLIVSGFVSYHQPIILSKKRYEYQPEFLSKSLRSNVEIDLLNIVNRSVDKSLGF